MDRLDLDRREGESDFEYLDRLRGMDAVGWSVDDVMTHALLIRYAQEAVAARSSNNGTVPEFLALLQQIRDLGVEQRRHLARWLAQGMPPTEPASAPKPVQRRRPDGQGQDPTAR